MNLQVLKIPCVAISGSTSRFLNDIVAAIDASKHLRVVALGEIKDTVVSVELHNTVEPL